MVKHLLISCLKHTYDLDSQLQLQFLLIRAVMLMIRTRLPCYFGNVI
jgi:hypothetical protein